jgi:hypothetical protein
MSLHAISHIQVQHLTTLLAAGQSPKDLRGLHNNRPRAISDTIVLKIKEHIESFPLKTSHYSAKTKHYLDATLNVKTMHNLFVKKCPDMQHLLKYEFYLKYFNENYALKFGRPQVDVCSECERLGAKLKDKNLNDNAKRVVAAELMVHKRRAKKFYTYIDGLVSHSFKLLKQNKRSPSLPTGRAYKEPVPINQNKVNDVKKVMQYITGEVLEFYYYVTSWKTTNSNLDDD